MLEYSAAIVCGPLVPSEAGLCKSHGSHLLLDKKGVIISSNFRMTPASAQDDVEQNDQDDHILTSSLNPTSMEIVLSTISTKTPNWEMVGQYLGTSVTWSFSFCSSIRLVII